MKTALYWLPRVLAILFTIFISIFALDSFDSPEWLIALLIHLIPSYILVAVTIISWKHEQIGGGLFIICGILMAIRKISLPMLSLPLFLIGGLFLLYHFLYKNK